jgi:hypothetical protein
LPAWRLFCLLRCDVFGVRCRNRAILFLGDELSTGSLSCGNDFVEALITAQIIPARIEAEIAVCDCIMFMSRNGRNFFELDDSGMSD